MHTMKAMADLILLLLLLGLAAGASAQGTASAPAPAAAGPVSISRILSKAGQFNTFLRLLKSTAAADQIDHQLKNSGGGMTVFAPTDNAFTQLPSGSLNSLSDQQKTSLVQFHVVSTLLPTAQLQTVSNPLRTQAGNTGKFEYPLNVTAEGTQVNISTGVVNATVDNTLYSGDQLVVYQVNKVLLPMALFGPPAPAPTPLPPQKTKKKDEPGATADTPGADAAAAEPKGSVAAEQVRGFGGGFGVALVAAAVWWAM